MSYIILMYHGLYESEADLAATISAEDRPYAVSRAAFRRHLAMIKQHRLDNSTAPEIVLTFDDGHISNYSMALPDLQEAGLSAYFFITSGFVGSREHFCESKHLMALHQAGMTVGSHGATHRFLDNDLGEKELTEEFVESKQLLEAAIDAPVRSISFPGGRYSKSSVELAQHCGYEELFGSRTGINSSLQSLDQEPLLRVAVRSTSSDEQIEKIISGNTAYYTRVSMKYALKTGLRKLLGNRLYHGLYKSIAGG